MIRTALIYKLVDHCLDVVFDKILHNLQTPETILGLKPGQTVHWITIEYNENYHRTFYYPTIVSMGSKSMKIEFRSSATYWILGKQNRDEFVESLRGRYEKESSRLVRSMVRVVGNHSVCGEVTYIVPLTIDIAYFIIDVPNSNLTPAPP